MLSAIETGSLSAAAELMEFTRKDRFMPSSIYTKIRFLPLLVLLPAAAPPPAPIQQIIFMSAMRSVGMLTCLILHGLPLLKIPRRIRPQPCPRMMICSRRSGRYHHRIFHPFSWANFSMYWSAVSASFVKTT